MSIVREITEQSNSSQAVQSSHQNQHQKINKNVIKDNLINKKQITNLKYNQSTHKVIDKSNSK